MTDNQSMHSAIEALSEIIPAVYRGLTACNRLQLVDSINSIKFYTQRAEHLLHTPEISHETCLLSSRMDN